MGDNRSFLAPDCPSSHGTGIWCLVPSWLSPTSVAVRTLVSSSSSSSRKNIDADSLKRRTKRYTRLELLADTTATPHTIKRRYLQKVMQTHSVSQLKNLCRIRGLSLKGQKIDIAERLYDDSVQQDFLAGDSHENNDRVHDSDDNNDDTDSDIENESFSSNVDYDGENYDAEGLQNESRETSVSKPPGSIVASMNIRYADRNGTNPNQVSHSRRNRVERNKNLARHLRTHYERRETAKNPLGTYTSKNDIGVVAVDTDVTAGKNPSSVGSPLPEPLLFRGRPVRRIIQCPVCQQQFRDQKGLTMHVSRKPACRYAMSCPDCFQNFTTRQGLQLHLDYKTEKCPIHKPRSLASIFRRRP
jgi:hypothetical protein